MWQTPEPPGPFAFKGVVMRHFRSFRSFTVVLFSLFALEMLLIRFDKLRTLSNLRALR